MQSRPPNEILLAAVQHRGILLLPVHHHLLPLQVPLRCCLQGRGLEGDDRRGEGGAKGQSQQHALKFINVFKIMNNDGVSILKMVLQFYLLKIKQINIHRLINFLNIIYKSIIYISCNYGF